MSGTSSGTRSSGSGGGTSSSSSSQPSASTSIGSIYSHAILVQSTTNPTKVIKKYGLFQFEEDVNTTLWHVSSPLNLTPAANPFPKFKDHFPKFSGNSTISTDEHLIDFSNACHNIGTNDNDTCMRLFVNSLEGKVVDDFFDFPPNILSTWDELVYWFKSTFGQPKIPTDRLKEYNNITYNKGETIKSFNLHFTKLYNQIPELIRPQNQVAFMHYYNALPSSYHHRLEEKAIDNIRSSLQTCLEYEEQLDRTGLPKEDYAKQTDMSTILQLMQDINNQMIYFERKGITPTATVETSTQAATRNFTNTNFHPKSILPRAWCNFCEEHHEESTCEIKKNVRDRIFGKKPDTTIVVLDWAPQDDVMVVNTINKSYANKGKVDSSKTTFSPSTSTQNIGSQVAHPSTSHQVTTPSSKYNILNQLENIKVDATLLDMVTVPEQQQHLRNFMEGKTSNIANLTGRLR
jgi:hypothetical protein